MTAKLDVRCRQPAPVGRPLRAVGRLQRLWTRAATARAEIRSGSGSQGLAETDLLLTAVPAGVIDPSQADRLGWRVYD